jgi:hypothetical protein
LQEGSRRFLRCRLETYTPYLHVVAASPTWNLAECAAATGATAVRSMPARAATKLACCPLLYAQRAHAMCGTYYCESIVTVLCCAQRVCISCPAAARRGAPALSSTLSPKGASRRLTLSRRVSAQPPPVTERGACGIERIVGTALKALAALDVGALCSRVFLRRSLRSKNFLVTIQIEAADQGTGTPATLLLLVVCCRW